MEWTADQRALWSLHNDYRAMISAVSTWDDGNLPDDGIMESPLAFHRWFDLWVQRQRDRRPGENQAESFGFVIDE